MKKKNWLSAVLVPVMLISMMGSFALPAMAEEVGVEIIEKETSVESEVPSEENTAATALSIDQGETYQEYVGHSVQFTVTFEPEDCIAEDCIWSSSAPAVVSVDGEGNALFRSAGVATLEVATESGLSDQIVITVDAEAIDPADGITRAEWLHELVIVFEMVVEEEALPDNYFSDVTAEHPYYSDILLATEFGVIDIEAGEKLYPDSALTRDFAVSTLNFCLAYQLAADTEYTFSDAEYCTDPVAAQIALDRGWLLPTEEGSFAPSAFVTEEEFSAMLTDAAETWAGQEIDSDHINTYDFAEDVLVFPEDTVVSEGEEGQLIITDCPEALEAGDQFVVWYNGIPNVHTALSVTVDGADTVIETQLTEDAVAFDSVDAQGVLDFGAMEIIPVEGSEVTVTEVDSGVSTFGLQPYSTQKLTNIKVEHTLNIGAFSGSIEVVIENPQFQYIIEADRASVVLQGDTELMYSISADALEAMGIKDEITCFL